MSRVSEVDFQGWSPPQYTVTPAGKVSDATPGQWHNWGRWGDEDQVGTLNLLTPERVSRAAGLIQTGERYSLALPIGVPVPGGSAASDMGSRRTMNRAQLFHFFGCSAGDGVLGDPKAQYTVDEEARYEYSDDFLLIALQHTTQLDGFGAGTGHALYNGYWAGLVTARSGARRLGIHHRAQGVVGRALLLDVARYLRVERLPDRFRIGPELLLEVAAAQDVEIEPGDILLVRTGWLGWWFAAAEAERSAANPSLAPGIAAAAIPLLAERDVAMIAFDNVTSEVMEDDEESGTARLRFHIAALRDLGLQVGEYFDLDDVAAACDGDGRYAMFFVAAPLPVVGGAGSPLNPIVIR
jgi:kynurenine formamidase